MLVVIFRKWSIAAAMAFVALLGSSMSGCGDQNGGDEASRLASAAPQAPPAVRPAPPPRRKASPKWSTDDWGDGLRANRDGVLVKPDGSEIRGWGDRRVRRHVTAVFARMQYDFLTGDMAAVCKRVDPSLSSIPFSGNLPCETMLRRYARKLEKRAFEPSPLRFLWVREYAGVAGIWVEDRRDRRFRVPFGQERNSGWKLQLRNLTPTEALAMPLRVP